MQPVDFVIIFCSLVLIATLAVGILEFIGWIIRKFEHKPMATYIRRSADKK